MKINFTFRNLKITQEDREYAEKKIGKIDEVAAVRLVELDYFLEPSFPKETSKQVVMNVHLASGENIVVEESGITFRETLDKAQETAVRWARKTKEKKQSIAKKKPKPTQLMVDSEI